MNWDGMEDGPDDLAAANSADPNPVIRIVNDILIAAIQRRATDIHVDVTSQDVRVRFRIDGRLADSSRYPLEMRDGITNRLKIMTKLDIAEKRLPQDGRIRVRYDHREVEFRVATLPALFGERISLRRILPPAVIPLDELGFSVAALRHLQQAMQPARGLILVASEPKSGRTTTLYAILRQMHHPGLCTMTAEDPVAAELEWATQIQLRPNIGLNAAAALRSFLRHDVDLIMLGEIPDAETAEIVIEMAKGVATVSGIAAVDTTSALLTVLGFGAPPHLLVRVLRCVVAQRLVLRICERCRAPADVSADQRRRIAQHDVLVPDTATFWSGKGCDECDGSGYRGRTAVAEVLVPGDRVTASLGEVGSADLRQAAIDDGMLTFSSQAIEAAIAGQTTLDECLRIIAETQPV